MSWKITPYKLIGLKRSSRFFYERNSVVAKVHNCRGISVNAGGCPITESWTTNFVRSALQVKELVICAEAIVEFKAALVIQRFEGS